MKRKFHARFLGGVGGLTACAYPVRHNTFNNMKAKTAFRIGFVGVAMLALAWCVYVSGHPMKPRAQRLHTVNSIAKPFPQ